MVNSTEAWTCKSKSKPKKRDTNNLVYILFQQARVSARPTDINRLQLLNGTIQRSHIKINSEQRTANSSME